MAVDQLVVGGTVRQGDDANSAGAYVKRGSDKGITVGPIVAEKLTTTGGIIAPNVSKTTAYTATLNDFVIECDASGGAFSVTLPTAASADGLILVVKNVGASGTVTIDGSGAETIDGAATVALSSQWSTRMIQSNGTSWVVLAS